MTKVKELYKLFIKSSGIETDSRNCKDGSLFFALKGDLYDGNNFAVNAINQGACAAVVDDYSLKNEEKCFYVESSLLALQHLASYHRKRFSIPIIGITGTNGKTTTKELIAAVLQKKYFILYTPGNLNNHIGVPLTILSINESHQIAIVEMGASHEGEIKELCEIAQPNFGLITNIGRAHLEGFKTFEGIVATKGELYAYLLGNKGKIFVNGSNKLLLALSRSRDNVEYISGSNPLVTGTVDTTSFFLSFTWKSRSGLLHKIKTKLVGSFNFENAMAAIALGVFFEVDINDINSAISDYSPHNSRSQLIMTKNNTVILDAYNANPSSMHESIKHFSVDKDRVLILGDMKELGDFSNCEHKNVLDFIYLKREHFCRVILLGENFCLLKQLFIDKSEVFEFFNSIEVLESHLKQFQIVKKEILIKGSRGMKMENLLPYL